MQSNNQQYDPKGEEDSSESQRSVLLQEFNQLSNEQKIKRGLEITRSLIDSQTTEEIVDISDDLQSFILLSIEVSPFPTQSRKIMKYIQTDQLEQFLDKSNFVQVDDYSVVFANIEDLSYHNFENILNLDHLFNGTQFKIEQIKKYGKKAQIFEMEGSMETLLSLDKLNYYTVPLNNSQRGGKRLIFHSNQLSLCLTRMIEESEFFDKKNFSHVNNVFRLNNFAPGDKKFKSHYDTPFADESKNLYSKYTMIIYLTGNRKRGPPPLTIGNIVLKQIRENNCIIFDQKLEHEGNAYTDKNKIFIRTELIFKINNMDYNEEVARMFNMACYMTKESEQQQYSADLFNNCVKMRYRIQEDEVQKVYLMKKNLEITYVTDGNYYWFPRHIQLESIAVLVILDYFNGKIQNLKNVKIQSKALPMFKGEEVNDEFIFNLIQISSFSDEAVDNSKIQQYQNTKDFVPDSLCHNFTTFRCQCSLGEGENEKAMDYFNQKRNKTVKKLKTILDQNTILVFDNMIKINYSNIQIQKDYQEKNDLVCGKIQLSDFYINSEKKINFASCQCERYYRKENIVSFKTKKMSTFCLPDISFQTLPNGIKLSIDIFHNGFVYSSTETFKQPYTNKEETQSKEAQRNRYRSKYQNYNDYDDDDNQNDDDNEDNDDDDDDEDIDDDDEDDEYEDENEDDDKVSNSDDSNNNEKDKNNDYQDDYNDNNSFDDSIENNNDQINKKDSSDDNDKKEQKQQQLMICNNKQSKQNTIDLKIDNITIGVSSLDSIIHNDSSKNEIFTPKINEESRLSKVSQGNKQKIKESELTQEIKQAILKKESN